MNRSEFALHYHSMKFNLACHEQKGSAFQTLFEKIMVKHDPSFVMVHPSGNEGDWKCDGFSQATGTIYQCYAPDDLDKPRTAAEAAIKIKKDFDGAKEKWQGKMKRWVLVWSGDKGSLPAPALSALLELKEENEDFPIDSWGRQALWDIVAGVSESDRVDLFGVVPIPEAASETTAAEIQTLLNYLARLDTPVIPESLELTEITEKLARNKLSEAVRAMVRAAIPVSREVENYLKKHPDVGFNKIIANSLADKYKSLAGEGDADSDAIFGALVEFAAHTNLSQPRYYWAAVGIVTYYFQLCDIFER
jgi:hypothetical protein